MASNHKAQFLLDLGQFARARQTLDYPTPPVTSVRARGQQMAARIDRARGHAVSHELQTAWSSLGAGDDAHVRMHMLLDLADSAEPDSALALAAQLEFAGVVLMARLKRAHLLSRNGKTGTAALAMRELVEQMAQVQPADLYPAEAWWIAAQVFDANGDGDEALLALGRGAQWVRKVALPQVPDEYRDSFLTRNATNRALLAAADRRLTR